MSSSFKQMPLWTLFTVAKLINSGVYSFVSMGMTYKSPANYSSRIFVLIKLFTFLGALLTYLFRLVIFPQVPARMVLLYSLC